MACCNFQVIYNKYGHSTDVLTHTSYSRLKKTSLFRIDLHKYHTIIILNIFFNALDIYSNLFSPIIFHKSLSNYVLYQLKWTSKHPWSATRQISFKQETNEQISFTSINEGWKSTQHVHTGFTVLVHKPWKKDGTLLDIVWSSTELSRYVCTQASEVCIASLLAWQSNGFSAMLWRTSLAQKVLQGAHWCWSSSNYLHLTTTVSISCLCIYCSWDWSPFHTQQCCKGRSSCIVWVALSFQTHCLGAQGNLSYH